MPARVSTGDRDAVLRLIRWCAAVQTLDRVAFTAAALCLRRAVEMELVRRSIAVEGFH